MKVRNNFVSNSSTSSFCMISKYLNNDSDIKNHILNKDEVLVFLDGYDGQMVVNITDLKAFSYIKAYCEFFDEDVKYHLVYISANEVEKVDFSTLPKSGKAVMETFTIDQNICESTEELEAYLEDIENWKEIKKRANEIYQIFNRKEKIEKINKEI